MFPFDRRTPRWMIFLIDVAVCLFSITLAFLLRFNFAAIPQTDLDTFPLIFSFILGVRTLSFLLTGTYKGIVRHTGSKDAQKIFLVTTSASTFFSLANIISYYFINDHFIVPYSIIIIEYLCTTFIMISVRFIYKSLFQELRNPNREKTNVIIFGAGESGLITKRTLDRDAGMKYKVLGFIDDDSRRWGMSLEGVTISGPDKLEGLLKDGNVAQLIISIQNISTSRKQEIIESCLKYNTKILNVPPVSSWINGELSFKQIKDIRIEDLLERSIIKLDQKNIRSQTGGKTILVTGAAGSIGSELVCQISGYAPAKIILVDNAESPLHDIEIELKNKFPQNIFEIIVSDIKNKKRMESLFKKYSPQIIFHAAAYKHVPLMEHFPLEAIHTNVLGTRILADLSMKYGVEKFIMISTDKAVNPTNVMGASKRIAEMYVQSLNTLSQTKFITTRFGNVLGSNGSVIQLFRRQIENGGPVTVTHPDVTRYFMTIPEACQLVLEASAMGKGGEIFVFDMGQAVKISDLANKMIRLAGYIPGKEIKVEYIGLRPGEKLFEELLSSKENTQATHNPQILIGKVREYGYSEVAAKVDSLSESLKSQDETGLVKKMKEIVPEYKSNNSVYEELDKTAA